MRTIFFVMIGLSLFLILSPFNGCGGGEEPPQQEVPVPSEPQTKDQKEGPSVEEIVEVTLPEPPVEMAVEAETEAVAEPVVETEGSKSGDEIIIENQGYTEDKKKPVKLSHKKHAEEYEIACDSCHHVYQEGKNIWEQGDPVEKCVACHDPVEDQGNVIKLQRAFHNNCRDCHKQVTLEGREAPYKKCTDCHG